ncbi:hypothetical protein J6590_000221 [Homalodisca vitripennis]|nr:hypothetical protein J6590_000221 [Homalodisca vitripennis]
MDTDAVKLRSHWHKLTSRYPTFRPSTTVDRGNEKAVLANDEGGVDLLTFLYLLIQMVYL